MEDGICDFHHSKSSQEVKLQIVVLDGYVLNPGDLDWSALRALAPCTIHDRTADAEIASRVSNASIVLTNKVHLTRETILAAKDLRYIGVTATGYNNVDTVAAAERGVTVTNVPAYSTMSVAQLVFAHLLNLTHRVGHHAHEVRDGRWSASGDFAFWDFPLIELSGLVLGIVGFGRIGKEVAAIARSFGMNVLVHTTGAAESPGAAFVPLNEIFSRSDVVSLHCPLTEQTRGLVSKSRLSMMKHTAWIINTSRGPLIDEQALADALHGGRIAGAGLDVLSVEPPPPDHPLLSAPHCFITPHFAWASTAARRRLMNEVVENVRSFLRGIPRNIVNDR